MPSTDIKVPKWLDKTIDFLWSRREDLVYHNAMGYMVQTFDFPNYGGLSKPLQRKLSGDMVDFIQGNLPFEGYETKKRLRRHVIGVWLCHS